MDKVLVTGANGFIGRVVCRAWALRGGCVRAVVREKNLYTFPFGDAKVEIVTGRMSLREQLRDIDTVIHCAARAHVVRETADEPLTEFRLVNRDATANLAREAAIAGVRRFVFISSIGVLASRSFGRKLREGDDPDPQGPYAVSKWEAEQELNILSLSSNLEIVILRLPLVHGPHPKGNFLRLLQAIERDTILPLRGVRNRRSFLGVDNLSAAILLAAKAPGLKSRTFHLADTEAISVSHLVEVLAAGMGKHVRLFPMPRWMAMAGATFLGKRKAVSQLFDDLEVDTTAFVDATGWTPTVSVEEGLHKMARAHITRTTGELAEN